MAAKKTARKSSRDTMPEITRTRLQILVLVQIYAHEEAGDEAHLDNLFELMSEGVAHWGPPPARGWLNGRHLASIIDDLEDAGLIWNAGEPDMPGGQNFYRLTDAGSEKMQDALIQVLPSQPRRPPGRAIRAWQLENVDRVLGDDDK